MAYFEFISNPMQLMMYLGNDLIESVPLDTERISQPGYLGQFKRVLKEKYAQLIRQSAVPPEFLVVSTNQTSNKEQSI